jgi:hypothetical protein
MSAPLLGSHQELGLDLGQCYDRLARLGPYGITGTPPKSGDTGFIEGADNVDTSTQLRVPWQSKVKFAKAQEKCVSKNQPSSRTAVVIRTWHDFHYTPWHISMLRAMISELSISSGGQYEIHFLIHVQNDSLPIFASEELYNSTLESALPPEFNGMGTLWSVPQMKLIYPPPFPESLINFSGGDIYQAYRSLHFPLQYFASRHPEYDYFWHWEMDIRVTGHYYELFHQLTNWAESQPREYAWEKSANFFIPSLYNNSYSTYTDSIVSQLSESSKRPISGPQLPKDELLPIPSQPLPSGKNHITDLIALNPLFNPNNTRWAFQGDITGYGTTRPPTRASLITASRLSRRLLMLMHEEAYLRKHTMFPETFPASIALHYGLKAISAPIPIYFDRNWPSVHANEVFNNAPISKASLKQGMKGAKGKDGNVYFHGEGGSVFGPGEHVFRGSSYYSNAALARYLWRRWLGHENNNGEIRLEVEEKDTGESGGGGKENENRGAEGRMCLPMMIIHPIKED